MCVRAVNASTAFQPALHYDTNEGLDALLQSRFSAFAATCHVQHLDAMVHDEPPEILDRLIIAHALKAEVPPWFAVPTHEIESA